MEEEDDDDEDDDTAVAADGDEGFLIKPNMEGCFASVSLPVQGLDVVCLLTCLRRLR